MKLNESSLTELSKASRETKGRALVKLLIACGEANTEHASKLGVSLFGLPQKIILGSLSTFLNQWSPNHHLVHQRWTGL